MEKRQFEEFAERAFENLPELFKGRIDNVQIVVEDYPNEDQLKNLRPASRYELLGLYEGIPLEERGPWYGAVPTVPDRISLFQKNIEAVCRSEKEIERKIQEVLIHEIGHYFGMSDKEIHDAGY